MFILFYFRVDSLENAQDVYCSRSYDISVIQSKLKPTYKQNHTPQSIKNMIERCNFIESIKNDCLSAAYVLNIICNLNMLPKMLSTFNGMDIKKCLYTEFVDKVIECLQKLQYPKKEDSVQNESNEIGKNVCAGASVLEKANPKKGNSDSNPIEYLADKNPLLFLVFEETFRRSGLIEEQSNCQPKPEDDLPSNALEYLEL